MSTIKPFIALKPDPEWFRQLLALTDATADTDQTNPLRKLLEPRKESTADRWKLQAHQDSLETLIYSRRYVIEEEPAIYVYECESSFGSQLGIWAMTCLEDLQQGTIVTHEETLSLHEQRLEAYRKDVGIEGNPVLLTYHRQAELTHLTEQAVAGKVPASCFYKGSYHRLWCIKDVETIIAFQQAFEKIGRVYVADGHHRLGAAAAMHKDTAVQWISTLYVTTGQLRCREFHRMVMPRNAISNMAFFKVIEQCFYISAIPGNKPCRPGALHRFGLYFKGNWFQLDLKSSVIELQKQTDVVILQTKILDPLFGIKDPRTNKTLTCWSALEWDQMLDYSGQHPEAILFTLFPMSVEQLISQAEKQESLPPKSTFIEPKVPYGLLLYSHKIGEEKGKGAVHA